MTQPDFQQMIESANSIVLQVDPNGIIKYINPYGLQFFGYSENQLVGRHIVGTTCPEASASGYDTAAEIRDIMEHPEHYRVNPDENMTSDGEPVWVLWSNTPVRDNQGKMIALNAIGTDVTELVTKLGDGNPQKGFAMLKSESRVV